jgi:deoxyribodipyrimidine photo-lyase
MDQRRIRKLQQGTEGEGPVVYWMDREQRIFDNWALFACVRLAKQKGVGVEIVFHLDAALFRGTLRQLDFTCKSLAEVAEMAHSIGIPFRIIQGQNTANNI